MKHLVAISTMFMLLLFRSISFAADFPKTLNYQGTLQTNTGQPVNSPQTITFSLYRVPIGNDLPFWTETLANVPVSNGQFSVTLGAITPLDPSKFGGDTFLGIKISTQPEMLPRQKMTSVPYSFNGVPKGGIIMWSGVVNQVPAGWALCDGNNGTPDLRDRFIVGAGNGYAVGVKGGEATHILTKEEMPPHDHGGSTGGQSADHYHSGVLTSVNRDGSSGTRVREADPSGTYGGVSYSTGGASNNHTHAISIEGNGKAFENRPPYYALAFIIKL